MAPPKLTTAPEFAKRFALWLGLCACLVTQSCVGPDLEPPGRSGSSTPTNAAPTVNPPKASQGNAGSSAPTVSDQPASAASGGTTGTITTPPAESPHTAEDAGVDDAGRDAGSVRR